MRVIGYEARANSMREFRGGGVGGLSGRCPVGAGSVSNVVHGGLGWVHAGAVLGRCWVGVGVRSVLGRCPMWYMLGGCWAGAGSMRRFVNLCEDL